MWQTLLIIMFTFTPVIFWVSNICSNFQTEYIKIHTFEKSQRKKDGSSLAIHQEWTVNVFPPYKGILELRHFSYWFEFCGEWVSRRSDVIMTDLVSVICGSIIKQRESHLLNVGGWQLWSKIHVCYPKLYVSTSGYAGILCWIILEFNIGLPNKDVGP